MRPSMTCQLSSMWNLAAANRTYLLRGNSDDCRCLSGESHKFDLVSLLTRVYMHHRPNVARFQALTVQSCCQNYPVVFANHIITLLERISRDHIGFQGSRRAGKKRRTIRITDPAPLVSDMERRRYRRVRCICLVRRDGHHTPTLVNGYTITPAGAKETVAGIAL